MSVVNVNLPIVANLNERRYGPSQYADDRLIPALEHPDESRRGSVRITEMKKRMSYRALKELFDGGVVSFRQGAGTEQIEEEVSNILGKQSVVYMRQSERSRLCGGTGVVALNIMPDQVCELARAIGVKRGILDSLLERGLDSCYSVFHIPKKSGGVRTIEAPCEELKTVQRAILHTIVYKAGVTRYAHGFIHGRSIVTNAKVHSDKFGSSKKTLLKIDLRNFFPSLSEEVVASAMYTVCDTAMRRVLPIAMKFCMFEGRLPQGAPTSPALSNVAVSGLDAMLGRLAESMCATYTRYADDLTFVSPARDIFKIIPVVRGMVGEYGLSINSKKINVLGCGRRQKVTGVVINEKISIERRRRRNFRACLHNIETGKTDPLSVNMQKLSGTMAFFGMVCREQQEKFLEKFNRVKEIVSDAHEVKRRDEAAAVSADGARRRGGRRVGKKKICVDSGAVPDSGRRGRGIRARKVEDTGGAEQDSGAGAAQVPAE